MFAIDGFIDGFKESFPGRFVTAATGNRRTARPGRCATRALA